MPILILEGQEIPLTPEQAAADQTIIDTILPFYPDAANAEIKRETVDGVERIRMVKRPGTKGNSKVLESLLSSIEYLNPAIELSWLLKQSEIEGSLTFEMLLALQPAMHSAVEIGSKESSMTTKTISNLKNAEPIPSSSPITGF